MDDFRRAQIEAYLICQKRGHSPSNMVTASVPPQNICKWCGTYYWYTEPRMEEGMRRPTEEEIEEFHNA